MNLIAVYRHHLGSNRISFDGATVLCIIDACDELRNCREYLYAMKKIIMRRFPFGIAKNQRSASAFTTSAREILSQIAITNMHWRTSMKTPAVSSLEDYQTPAH